MSMRRFYPDRGLPSALRIDHNITWASWRDSRVRRDHAPKPSPLAHGRQSDEHNWPQPLYGAERPAGRLSVAVLAIALAVALLA